MYLRYITEYTVKVFTSVRTIIVQITATAGMLHVNTELV